MQENVMKNRNFLLSFLGAAVSNIGNLFYSFAVSFYLLSLTNNNAIIQGAYLGVCGAIFCVVVIFGGTFSDRYHNGKIMYICDYLKGLVITLGTLAILFIGNNDFKVVILFIVGGVGQVISGIFSPASTALLPKILDENQIQQANAYHSILNSVQAIIGAMLAALLYSILPATTIFFICAGCYVASAISEMFIRYNHIAPTDKTSVKVVLRDMKDGLKYLLGFKPLLILCIYILIINFFASPYGENIPAYIAATDITNTPHMLENILKPESWTSVFGIGMGMGSIIGSIILSSRPQKEKCSPALKKLLLLFGIYMMVMFAEYYIFVEKGVSMNAFLISMTLTLFIGGILLVFINIPISTTLIAKTDKQMVGKVSGLISCASQGLIPISTFLSGVVIQTLGVSVLALICGVGFMITAIIFYFNKTVDAI